MRGRSKPGPVPPRSKAFPPPPCSARREAEDEAERDRTPSPPRDLDGKAIPFSALFDIRTARAARPAEARFLGDPGLVDAFRTVSRHYLRQLDLRIMRKAKATVSELREEMRERLEEMAETGVFHAHANKHRATSQFWIQLRRQ